LLQSFEAHEISVRISQRKLPKQFPGFDGRFSKIRLMAKKWSPLPEILIMKSSV
jgi:hypothetical protein